MTDPNHLLREYVASGSEPAFRELVSRYVNLVYSVAVRRVNGDLDQARDVVQTVFTDLARKASRLRAESSLGGWLHRHTCFVASTFIRGERRRQAREKIAVEMNHLNQPTEAAWQQLAPVLDEAIDQLGEPDRQAIVLRFYEQRDLRSVGNVLGTNEDAAQKRISRALEKLRLILANKGIALSAAVLASVLTAHAVADAPSGLAAQAAGVALTRASAVGVIPTLIAYMSLLKLKFLLGSAALALIAGGLVYYQSTSTRNPKLASASPPGTDQAATVASGDSTTTPTANPPADSSTSPQDVLHLTVVAAEDGSPLSAVELVYRGWEGEHFTRKRFLSTRAGRCDVTLPRATITHLELTSILDGFADTRLDWQTDRGETIPDSYTLRLTRPVPISGRVVDESGAPVAGAKMGWNHQFDPTLDTRPESHAFGWIEVETDADGRWRINRIAPEMLRLLYGAPRHPDYATPLLLMVSDTPQAEQQLRDGTHVFHLGRTFSLTGSVLDPDAKPVPNANVFLGGPGSLDPQNTLTLADGTFSLSGCKPGKNLVTAEAAGFTATTLEVNVTETTPPVRLQLQAGRTLRLRVVDSAGQPIPDANVWYDTMRPQRQDPSSASKPPAVQIEFSPKTDSDGRAVWQAAPAGDLFFSFHKPGFMRLDDVKLQADADEHVVTLPPALVVSGTVTDAASGQPIPKFRIGLGWPQPGPDGQTRPRFSDIDRFWPTFGNGQFRHSLEEPLIVGLPANPGYMLRFEAEGYASFLSRVIQAGEGEVRLDVKLTPSHDLAVTVLLPNGQPAVNVEVGLLNPATDLRIGPGGFSRHQSANAQDLLHTDAAGVFKLPSDTDATQIVAASKAGFGQATLADLQATPKLALKPWGRIEGTFAAGPKAVNRLVSFSGATTKTGIPLDSRAYRSLADSNGHFVLEQVPPGEWAMVRLFEETHGTTTSTQEALLQKVTVAPGETVQVALGQNSRSVQGRIALPPTVTADADTRVYAVIHTPFPKPPAAVQNDPAALQQWSQSPDVQAIAAKMTAYPLMQDASGTWMADEVAPGDYVLSVNVIGKRVKTEPASLIAKAELSVVVSSDAMANSLDLGEIAVQPAAP